ncbi:MAG: SDR family oxidoreductase [bacterium]
MAVRDPFSLEGKLSVVTGGLGLLGSAITKALAESGSKVIVLDIDCSGGEKVSSDLRDTNHNIFYEKGDITDFEKIKVNIENLEKKYGNIDVWVNNAYPRTEDWGDKLEVVKTESFRRDVDIQLNSYCICSNEIALRMAARQEGSIISIASIYGTVAPDFTIYEGTDMTTPAAYSAIKGGIIAYSKYLASYFRNDGLRINVVCPGGIYNNQSEEFIKRYSGKTLLGRMAGPYEIAWPVVFLASRAASYITGTTLMVDGGWTTI